MQIVELTPKEDRLGMFEAILSIKRNLKFSRCFYISHKKHGDDFLRDLEESLGKLQAYDALTSEDILVIDRSSEAGSQMDHRHARFLREFRRSSGLRGSNIVYASQSSYLPSVREAFEGDSLDDIPTWVQFQHFPYMLSKKYLGVSEEHGYSNLHEINTKILCTNFKIRAHRRLLVEYLISSGMSEDFILSYHANDMLGLSSDYRRVCERRFPRVDKYIRGKGRAKELEDNPVMRIPGDDGKGDFIFGFPEQAVEKSILSLVCETDFDPACIRITEKSIKPMVYHRPFILWGAMGALSLVRDLGFRTFGDVIDESYDRIAFPEERFMRLIFEIKRLLHELESLPFRAHFLETCHAACAWNQEHISNGGLKTVLERSLELSLNYLAARRPCFDPTVLPDAAT